MSHAVAVLAFFCATFFSWLTWRESALARADAAEQFLAEKAPRLTVSAVYEYGPMVSFLIKNDGDSTAKQVTVSYHLIDNAQRRDVPLEGHGLDSNPKGFNLSKLDEELYSAFDSRDLEALTKRKPVRYELLGKLPTSNNIITSPAVLIVKIDYKDIRGEDHRAKAYIDVQLEPEP